MAEFREQITMAKTADADLSAKAYHILRVTGAYTTNQASFRQDTSLWGVLETKPRTGENAALVVFGFTKVVAGAATTAGATLTTDSSGRAINAQSGDHVLGWGKEAAGATGDIISCFVSQSFRLL
jgi:hypothetical protein